MAKTVLLPDQLFADAEPSAVVYMHPFFFKNACKSRIVHMLTAAKASGRRIVWKESDLPERFDSYCSPNRKTQKFLEAHGEPMPSPGFLLQTNREAKFGEKRSMMSIYKELRREYLPELQDGRGQPKGGKWSLDEENRKGAREMTKDRRANALLERAAEFDRRLRRRLEAQPARAWALRQTEARFPRAPGEAGAAYPADRRTALACLAEFLKKRLTLFVYQDALPESEAGLLVHSRLSMALNLGLLTPKDVARGLGRALAAGAPLSAAEGFARQVLGWREYMLHCYLSEEVGEFLREPSGGHMKSRAKLPRAWYRPGEQTTGVKLVDRALVEVHRTGYAHHIERLMVLGAFMLMAEVAPIEAYRWFLTMFVDAHEWVMAGNVLCMSQYAIRGWTARPYFSSSAYLRKMSDAQDPEGYAIWDRLFRQFLVRKREILKKEYIVSRWLVRRAKP